jgi:hypothetical protein
LRQSPEERPMYRRKSRYDSYPCLSCLNARSSQRTISQHNKPAFVLSIPSSQVTIQVGNSALFQAWRRPTLSATTSTSTGYASGGGVSSLVTRAHLHIPGGELPSTCPTSQSTCDCSFPNIIPTYAPTALSLSVSTDGWSCHSTSNDRRPASGMATEAEF